MSDRHDHDYDLIVMDLVEDAIVPHAEPDDPGVTFERLDSGSGVGCPGGRGAVDRFGVERLWTGRGTPVPPWA